MNGPTSFGDIDNLGTQKSNPLGTPSTLVFTCKCGFVDIGHLRHGIDRTVSFYKSLQRKLSASGSVPAGAVIPGLQSGAVKVGLLTPVNVPYVPSAPIENADFPAAAQSLAYSESVAYEDRDPTPGSSYSFEDLTSNLMGTLIGERLLNQPETIENHDGSFRKRADDLVKKLIQECDPVSKADAKSVWEKHVKGKELGQVKDPEKPLAIECDPCKGRDRTPPEWLKKGQFKLPARRE